MFVARSRSPPSVSACLACGWARPAVPSIAAGRHVVTPIIAIATAAVATPRSISMAVGPDSLIQTRQSSS